MIECMSNNWIYFAKTCQIAVEVPAELFKAEGETVLDRMHRICVAIWKTGEWPEEWTFSTFNTLPKKGDLKQCANYRTIARLTCKQDPSSEHTKKDPNEDRNINCRRTGEILTREGDKIPNHESQNTDAQGTRAPTTTLHVLCRLQEGVRLYLP